MQLPQNVSYRHSLHFKFNHKTGPADQVAENKQNIYFPWAQKNRVE